MVTDMFKVQNRLVCVNFTNETMNWINKVVPKNKKTDARGNNVHGIHIFVFNINEMDVSKLTILANACKANKLKCFVHCFSQSDKEFMKHLCCHITDNKFFAINCESIVFTLTYSNQKYMNIFYREIEIKTDTKGVVQTIKYEYNDNYGSSVTISK